MSKMFVLMCDACRCISSAPNVGENLISTAVSSGWHATRLNGVHYCSKCWPDQKAKSNTDVFTAFGDMRVVNALEMAGIKTISDVLKKTDAELLRLPNLGRKSLAIIKMGIKDLGFDTLGNFKT